MWVWYVLIIKQLINRAVKGRSLNARVKDSKGWKQLSVVGRIYQTLMSRLIFLPAHLDWLLPFHFLHTNPISESTGDGFILNTEPIALIRLKSILELNERRMRHLKPKEMHVLFRLQRSKMYWISYTFTCNVVLNTQLFLKKKFRFVREV